ncbi:MAG: hypothetical protein ACK42A_11355 [Pyrinomonadaceae bacterium]
MNIGNARIDPVMCSRRITRGVFILYVHNLAITKAGELNIFNAGCKPKSPQTFIT